jgi:hypothetical protein
MSHHSLLCYTRAAEWVQSVNGFTIEITEVTERKAG